jgi:hypothetical protein
MDIAALRRWWPLAAVLALLFVTSLAATRSAPQLEKINREPTEEPPLLPTAPPKPTLATEPPKPEVADALPPWAGSAALILLGGLGLIVLGVVIAGLIREQAQRRKGRRGVRGRRRDQASTADELVAALDAGLEELSDADIDPRRAVIACWVRLEQAAAAAGTARHPGDSPTDLVGRLLREQRVDAQVLAALLDVYRQARYATHTVDDEMRQQARSALQRLRADLGTVVTT